MTTRKKLFPIYSISLREDHKILCISLDVTENKTQKHISSHAYNLSNHVIIKVNYTLNGKCKAIVRINAQFSAIIITELTSTDVFVFQCCQVSGIDHGIDGQQNF